MAKKRTDADQAQVNAAPEATSPAQPAAQAEETITKKEAVMRALAEGIDMPAAGVPFIKERFGLDVSNQQFSSYKMQLRGSAGSGRKKGGRKPGRKPGPKPAAAAAPQTAAAPRQSSPVDLIEKTLDLASQAGGVQALKKLVDMLAAMRQW